MYSSSYHHDKKIRESTEGRQKKGHGFMLICKLSLGTVIRWGYHQILQQ